MVKLTFENIYDQVVNSRTISRKEKQIAISKFVREYSGDRKPTLKEEIEMLESLKALRKAYSQQGSLAAAK